MQDQSDLIILIDALRHDYIDAERTPFLFDLKRNHLSARVVESFSFQTRPAYFAGLEPEESDICNLYEFNPEQSPFSFLKPLSGIARALDASGLHRYTRGVIRRLAKRRALAKGHPAAADVMGVEKIPLQFLPYFALSEKHYTDDLAPFGEAATIFDLLRKGNKSWAWIGYPRHFGSTDSILSAFEEHPPVDLAYLHFSELDWIGHRYGPDSEELDRNLNEMDKVIERLVEPALAAGRAVAVFGDHGMVEVEYSIDLLSRLQKLDLKAPEDYLYFLDSTQARFWFFHERARSAVTDCLEEVDGGHVVLEAERQALRVNFRDNRYGDLLFALDGPGIIHPSFFGDGPDGPKGMHGYVPAVEDNMTQIVVSSPTTPSEDLGTIPMTGIYDLLCDAFLR